VQTATTEKLLVNISEASSMLGIGRTLFYQMSADGRLGPRPVTFGKKKLWRTEELRHWVEAACPGREKWQQIKGTQNV
jgi:predicted DNA-binding transcriptional regulator AlpA